MVDNVVLKGCFIIVWVMAVGNYVYEVCIDCLKGVLGNGFFEKDIEDKFRFVLLGEEKRVVELIKAVG